MISSNELLPKPLNEADFSAGGSPKKDVSLGLEELDLPRKIALIDVNGTLISETDPSQKFIIPEHKEALRKAISEAQQRGWSVGLCSDSPIPQLRAFGQDLGMGEDLVVVAENGNVVSNKNGVSIVNPLPNVDGIKKAIKQAADDFGLQQREDCVAPEFGGKPVEDGWAFGANRIASVAAFGSAELIDHLKSALQLPQDTTADFSPKDRFLGIHPRLPDSDFTGNKGYSLGRIGSTGREVVMIGNSKSDWVDPKTGVVCMFVQGSRISDTISKQAYVSSLPLAQGVIDALGRLA